MQNESWMQPALQVSEAVLLPALERRSMSMPRFGNRFLSSTASSDAFRPVEESWEDSQPLALSTYVRPRGSMAGRSILRAAGVRTDPVWMRQTRALSARRSTYTAAGRFRR